MRIFKNGGMKAVFVFSYHTFMPHEDGTVIFEAKDRAYDPESTEDLL